MKLQLPNSVLSPQDLTALILEIRQYARWVSHAAVKKRLDQAQTSEPPVLSPAAAGLIDSWGSSQQLSPQSLDSLIESLEDFKADAPTMTMTLAAPPAGELKRTLVAWCRDNVEPGVLVNFQFNSTILGGMVVRYGSHVYDWSFRRQILAGRDKFPEVLRRV